MKKSLRVLLIDDFPIMIDAYKTSLKQFNLLHSDYSIVVDSAKCCDSALEKFELSLKKQPYDLVFLELRLPSKNSNIRSGIDLGTILKDLRPSLKLVIITGDYDAFVFTTILKNINPDGLIYKSDMSINTVGEVLNNVLNDVPFYSSRILQLLRKNISSKIVLSDIDRLLLLELSKGSKTKNLKKVLPLSQGGIEKRKRHLKEVFNTQKLSDEILIETAKKKGFF